MKHFAVPGVICFTQLLAAIVLGPVGCGHSAPPPPPPPPPYAEVSALSFTGPGLDGVPMSEGVDESDNDHFHDTNAPSKGVDQLITAPEYVRATLRSKPGLMPLETRFHIKVAVTIKNQTVYVAKVSAVAPGHPELNLPEQPLQADGPGSTHYHAILQIPAPIMSIDYYEDFTWRWTIRVNGVSYFDSSTNTLGVSVWTGTTPATEPRPK